MVKDTRYYYCVFVLILWYDRPVGLGTLNPMPRVQEMSRPVHVKDPFVEFVKSRLLGAAT